MSPSKLNVKYKVRPTKLRGYSFGDDAQGEISLKSIGLEDRQDTKEVYRHLQSILSAIRPPGVRWGRLFKEDKEDSNQVLLVVDTHGITTVPPVIHNSLDHMLKENKSDSGDSVQRVLREFCKVFPEFRPFIDDFGNEDIREQFRQALGTASEAIAKLKIESKTEVLETFKGFVESLDGDTALLKFEAENGDVLYGQQSASELIEKGIFERRRFKCIVKKDTNGIHMDLQSIPDKELSDDRVREIWDEIEENVGTEDWDDAD